MGEIGFTVITNEIFRDKNLSSNEKIFLAALKSFDHRRTGVVFPAYKILMEYAGISSRNTLSNIIKRLKEKKYITVKKRNRVNYYTFIKDYLLKDVLAEFKEKASQLKSKAKVNNSKTKKVSNENRKLSCSERGKLGNENGKLSCSETIELGNEDGQLSSSETIGLGNENGELNSKGCGKNSSENSEKKSLVKSENCKKKSLVKVIKKYIIKNHDENYEEGNDMVKRTNSKDNNQISIFEKDNTNEKNRWTSSQEHCGIADEEDKGTSAQNDIANVNSTKTDTDNSSKVNVTNSTKTNTDNSTKVNVTNNAKTDTGTKVNPTNSTKINTIKSTKIDTFNSIESDTEKRKDKNKKENYIKIINRWNSKNILNEDKLSDSIKACINIALKEFTIEEIIKAIDNYHIVYNSSFYYDYTWTLKNFLARPNGIGKFVDNGEAWQNYLSYKKRKAKKKSRAYQYID